MDKLTVRWSKTQEDIVYNGHGPDKRLCHQRMGTEYAKFWMAHEKMEFKPSFFEELEKRGYDLTTFKMSVQKRKDR